MVYARILTTQVDSARYDIHNNAMIQSTPKQSSIPLYTKAAALLAIATAIGSANLHASTQPTNPNPNPTPSKTQTQDDTIKECVVTLISGRKITGELVREDDLIVVISINGIDTTFQRKNVASVNILPPVKQRYKELRAAIPDDDIESRLILVEWLRTRKAYTLAIEELDSVLLIDPANPHATLLHTWLTEHDKLAPAKPKPKSSIPTKNRSKPTSTRSQSKLLRNNIPPLTPEQINLIKVYEIDLRDPPKLKVPDETIETLMLRHPQAFSPNKEDRNAIFKLPEVEKLKLLFTHKARDLYHQVRVLEDPKSIKYFKGNVHAQRGWLLNACATTRCHGGINAGRFQLINSKPNTDQTVYTNLLILEKFKLKDGSPLINHNAPERSPLLQMAMIPQNTLTPHPQIPKGFPGKGFRPIFRSTRDRKYRDAIEWIKSMYQPRPEYDFIPSPLSKTEPPTPAPDPTPSP